MAVFGIMTLTSFVNFVMCMIYSMDTAADRLVFLLPVLVCSDYLPVLHPVN